MSTLHDAITLRSGAVLRNRIAKAAMSEVLATPDGRVTSAHLSLYDTWATSGAGLLVTGNMMVDGRHMNEPLVVDALHPNNFTSLRKWAAAGKEKRGAHLAATEPPRQAVAQLRQRFACGALGDSYR